MVYLCTNIYPHVGVQMLENHTWSTWDCLNPCKSRCLMIEIVSSCKITAGKPEVKHHLLWPCKRSPAECFRLICWYVATPEMWHIIRVDSSVLCSVCITVSLSYTILVGKQSCITSWHYPTLSCTILHYLTLSCTLLVCILMSIHSTLW